MSPLGWEKGIKLEPNKTIINPDQEITAGKLNSISRSINQSIIMELNYCMDYYYVSRLPSSVQFSSKQLHWTYHIYLNISAKFIDLTKRRAATFDALELNSLCPLYIRGVPPIIRKTPIPIERRTDKSTRGRFVSISKIWNKLGIKAKLTKQTE